MSLLGDLERKTQGRVSARFCSLQPAFTGGSGEMDAELAGLKQRRGMTPPVAPPFEVLVLLLGQAGPLGNAEIRRHLGLKDRTHLRVRYLDPALADGLIEPTVPDRPNSRLQRYRLTVKGAALVESLRQSKPKP